MDELSLFTGAGGGIWASKLLGWRTLGYVEKDSYCQRVVRRRIWDGQFDNAPIFGDVRAFVDQGYARSYQGMVDVVTAGFPCTPFSVAGKRGGADDERNMWPATAAVLRDVRPEWALLENVPGLLSSGYFEAILADLATLGYYAEWCVLGARHVGAPHRRDRLWILAHSASERGSAGVANQESRAEGHSDQSDHGGQDVAHAQCSERRSQHQTCDDQGTDGIPQWKEGSDWIGGRCQVMAHANGSRFKEHQEFDSQAEQDSADGDSWGGYPGRRDREKDMADTESRELGESSESQGWEGSSGGSEKGGTGCSWWDEDPADVVHTKDSVWRGSSTTKDEGGRVEKVGGSSLPSGGWSTQPRVGRVVDELAYRVDRLRATGNGQVPLVAATAWHLLRRRFED